VISILTGALLGFLSGLGVGGGSLLVLWLTLVRGVEPSAARNVNLLFFLPCACIAAVFRWKQGSLPVKKILPAILSGCAAALLFSLIGTNMDVTILKKLFGALLILTGIREIFYKSKT
jgi:uncharacterized membrane protein YfcA